MNFKALFLSSVLGLTGTSTTADEVVTDDPLQKAAHETCIKTKYVID